MFKSQQKRIDEMDYTTDLDVKSAVDYINQKNNNYNHSDVIRALYDNDINYLQQNYRNVVDEFNNGNYRDISDFTPAFQTVPSETLEEFKRSLEQEREGDLNYMRTIDDEKEQERRSEMNGFLVLNRDLTQSIDDILTSRREDKKELLENMGIAFNYNDGMDPFKRRISEMAEGVEYNITQNQDGTYVMDVNKGGQPLLSIEYDQNGEVDLDNTRAYYDRTENFTPAPENLKYKNENNLEENVDQGYRSRNRPSPF
jgi:hypothetical protein